MCFNSKVIQSEVQRRATQIFGKAIWAGIKRLKQQGKERLFAGVIAGWETHIGQDFDTGRYLGYRALINRGFTKDNPPPDMDGELENKNMDFHVVTEGEEALLAYRKFLRGERLAEVVSPVSSYLERLPPKIRRIQRELPAWVQRTDNQAQAEPLVKRLDGAWKANNLPEAEKVADEILKLLSEK